jgi:hypothetical protein
VENNRIRPEDKIAQHLREMEEALERLEERLEKREHELEEAESLPSTMHTPPMFAEEGNKLPVVG